MFRKSATEIKKQLLIYQYTACLKTQFATSVVKNSFQKKFAHIQDKLTVKQKKKIIPNF